MRCPNDAAVLPREHLIRALEADLVGPFQPDADAGAAEEVLPIPPSRWYLTGFLAPQEGRDPQDPTSEEGFGAGPDDESEESASQDPETKQQNRLPASLGLGAPRAGRPERDRHGELRRVPGREPRGRGRGGGASQAGLATLSASAGDGGAAARRAPARPRAGGISTAQEEIPPPPLS